MEQPTGAPAPQTRPGESDPDMDEALRRVRTTPRPSAGGPLRYQRRDVAVTMSRVLGR